MHCCIVPQPFNSGVKLKNGCEKIFNLTTKCVIGNPKSSFIINTIILNTKKVIYMNRQTGKEMHVNSVKYHVYQQLKVDEHKANLNMTMPQFDEKWNIVYDSLRHFGNGH